MLIRGNRACSPEVSVSFSNRAKFEVRGKREHAKEGIPVA